jgi:polyhydroxyalkanoate synthesis regulator phasin
MKRSTKLAAAGLTAGLLTGGAMAVVGGLPTLAGASSSVVSQSDDSTPDTAPDTSDAPDDSVDRAAAREERLRETLQPLVDDGTLTPAQLDAVVAKLAEAAPLGGEGRRGHGPGFGHGHGLEAAATAIGITEDELTTALRGGSTIAEVAQSKGVEPQVVVDAIVAQMSERIDQAVTDGKIDADQAAEMKEQAAQRATDLVNGELPVRGDHHGRDQDDDGSTDTTAPASQD